MSDFLSSATWPTLRIRARLLAATRAFFDQRGFTEVDTPLLSADRVIDTHLSPYAARNADAPRPGEPPLYLQTSPEFAMKRLLASGARDIYQLGKVFRADETGRQHNPEFTLLEWYESDATDADVMETTERLLRHLDAAFRSVEIAGDRQECEGDALPARPFRRRTYTELFLDGLGIDPLLASTEALAELARRRLGKQVPESQSATDRDGWLNLLLATLLERQLGQDGPEFLTEYPSSQAALARLRPRSDGQPVAGRFELYWRGVELCNGYHELTDASELRQRIEAENVRRQTEGLAPLPTSSRLLDAMDRGLPPCAGNAVGFDRVLMLLLGADRIDAVIPFPTHRA